MEVPIRSRLYDYVEHVGPRSSSAVPPQAGKPRRSRLLDYAEAQPPAPRATAGPPAPRPGVPPYHTPVFVPAHPRYVEAEDGGGRRVRVPFVACELFADATNGTVAFAFTTLDRLVAALGEAQPWVATSIGPLAEGVREHGATVLLDPRIAPGHPNWRPEDLAAYARKVR
ncbi:hypothetical protein GCM10014715_61310 [Streptomyces spiralis]|uniref:SseB protein N-terminal domain-containing protein n=1 Tax=Streptomyces spiralis TaxID=66376 RepID=A0A919E094_9ACTN|nr:SAV_915 family protein [Streptomyces spiralis]GHE96769.1 hypothetical protein GCM10014715_61310 [Streptomyces spiralis]